MKDTSSVGQIGEAAVMQRLLRAGWRVLVPYGNAAPYDLAAEKDGRILRIQVRTTSARHNFISVNCRTKNNRVRMRADDFDYLAVYELGSDAVFIISADEAAQRAVLHIRLVPALSGQLRGIRPAEDYRERWDRLDVGA